MKKILSSGLLALSLVTSLSAASNTVDLNEKTDLQYMREEEKVAGDVYKTFYNLYKINIFLNISSSEAQHSEAIRKLLVKYSIKDPATKTFGVFTNVELQSLYNKLIAEGKVSSTKALTVGATIEEIDIVDLKRAINATDNPDIKNVYNNLLNGSKNHLIAFTSNLAKRGVYYAPQYLSTAEYNSIVK